MVKYLFNCLSELQKFKDDHNTAIISDIDGTLSEIGKTPIKAKITPEMRTTLRRIRSKFKFSGVLTGRDIKDAFKIIKLKNIVYMGNHGLNQYDNGKITVDPKVIEYIPVIKDINEILQRELDSCNGFLFDYKTLSLTIPYSACDDKNKSKQIILDIISSLELSNSIKIIEGRNIIEIRPPVGHDKGTILQKFVFDNHINKIMYLGDDINDVSAFDKLNELAHENRIQAISIVVNSNQTPNYVKEAADFYVENVGENQIFLRWLCGRTV